MCLSTAYKNEMSDDTAIMENVMLVECDEGKVILTDLFGVKNEIDGTLLKASLTDGYVIIKVND
jgi:predicted RNA-binding protein